MAVNVGLDIGANGVRAVALDIGKQPPVIRRIGQVDIERGAVVAGEIVDAAAVTDAVSRLWKEAKLPKRRIVLGLANQRVIVRQVDVPRMSEVELAEALPFQVQEYIPIPVEETFLDFVPIEEFTTPEGEPMLSILVVAAQRDMVETLLSAVGAAGVTPVAVDLQAFGLIRALFYGDFDLETTTAVVDIGSGVSQVVLVRAGEPRFIRLLQMGGEDFTSALVDGLDLTWAEAEDLKRQVGVTPVGGDSSALSASLPVEEEHASPLEARAVTILDRQAEKFIDEVRGSVNFYLGQADEPTLSRIIVSGNGARLPHLANRLGDVLGARIEPARVIEGLNTGKLSEGEVAAMQPIIPVPVGLALWEG
ncbi:MAG: type IV pilus assembly protein PilM [Acidimicrobiia bacterium]|nr:type IV pilus assembly protein PilM [Acidimicrobiia bacterium]